MSYLSCYVHWLEIWQKFDWDSFFSLSQRLPPLPTSYAYLLIGICFSLCFSSRAKRVGSIYTWYQALQSLLMQEIWFRETNLPVVWINVLQVYFRKIVLKFVSHCRLISSTCKLSDSFSISICKHNANNVNSCSIFVNSLNRALDPYCSRKILLAYFWMRSGEQCLHIWVAESTKVMHLWLIFPQFIFQF
jgi:hypothetical protein